MSNGTGTPIPVLQESKNKNGFGFLEKHVLKEKTQRDQSIMYNVTGQSPGRKRRGGFRWGVLVLIGERTHTDFLRP